MRARPAIIVLAAGRGPRFQRTAQQLLQHPGAPSVLGATLRQALSTQLHVLVVTTPQLVDVIRPHIASRDIVVMPGSTDGERPNWGVGDAIAAGVSALATAPGWLLLPGDVPTITPATMLAVGRALEHHSVSHAQFNGRRGHPVGFSSEMYSELIKLHGDEGARRLVARYPAFAVEVGEREAFTLTVPGDLASPLPDLAAQRVAGGSEAQSDLH